MKFAEFSVSRPVAVTMRIASLVLLGAICLTKLPVDLLPKVSLPTVVVNTGWTNVAPEAMETQVTRPIEQAVSSAPNAKYVTSSSTLGNSSVRIQFEWGTDIGQASVNVMQLVQRAKRSLPNDPNLSEPAVFRYDPSQLPILVYAVTGIDDPVKLKTLMANEVSPILESANGVASATVSGGLDRSILVNVDPAKLQALGVTLADVQKRVSQENLDLPSGITKRGNKELTIRADGYFTSVQQIAAIPIISKPTGVVTLGEVAKVEDKYQDQRIWVRVDGKPAVGVQVVKQSDANTISTADAFRTKLANVQKEYPQLKFSLIYDQSNYIENSVDDLKMNAILGGVLAIIVLLFFLRSIRSTLVVALSIPISILSTFTLLYFGGFTLNTISLSGLALATGLIVDDAVVVLENIFRHIERDGKKAAVAAVTGTSEILGAVVASTLTVMIVFMPLLLINGQSGQMFTQFALVVIFSMAVSLLDALTVVPMLASRVISEEEVQEEAHPELREKHGKKRTLLIKAFDWFGAKFNAMDAAYRHRLQWCLKHRWWVVGGSVAITLLSLLIVPMIGSEMLPQSDTGVISMNVKLPIGTAVSVTNETMAKVEDIIRKDPNVETCYIASGTNLSIRGTSTSPISYQGGGLLRLKENRKLKTDDVIKSLRKKIGALPNVTVNLNPYDIVNQILTGGPTNMEVDVFGTNNKEIFAKAKEVMGALQGVAGLEGVDLSIQEANPELHWTVDRKKAGELGVSFQDVGNTLNIASSGALATYYQENGFQYPIYVQVPHDLRVTPDQLAQLPISKSGPPVLLNQVATPYVSYGPSEVTRQDRQRYVAVTGRVTGRADSEVQADVSKAMAGVTFENGMTWDFGNNLKQRSQEFGGLGLTLFLAIALIYMLLASQFESFIYPLVILVSVPLATIGVVVALFVTGKAFGLTAFIGLLMLVGIAVKNGILLVDYTNQLRGRGMPRDEAILTASPTRLRPILMTSSAAILGMLPLALQLGKGSETQAPLATAVIGGLLTSTILTLFIVPAVYTMFDDLSRLARKDKRDLAPTDVLSPSVGALDGTQLDRITAKQPAEQANLPSEEADEPKPAAKKK